MTKQNTYNINNFLFVKGSDNIQFFKKTVQANQNNKLILIGCIANTFERRQIAEFSHIIFKLTFVNLLKNLLFWS